jgi:bacteriocin biosynthesis cyclodehydratase domain-containing protein
MSAAPAYQLRGSLELFLASDGNAYLLRGSSGDEHVIAEPSADDRALLERLAAGPVHVAPASVTEQRLLPLIEAGAVVRAPDVGALAPGDGERFARQLPYLEDIAPDAIVAQRRLRESSVAVLGCGGLGTWALGALASTGVGRFVLIDHDHVELSNLNRQILYGVDDIGTAKVERAADWVRRFDPSIRVEPHRRRVQGPEDLDVVAGCDILLLLADWPPYELPRWVNAAALTSGVPYMLAGQQPPLIRIGPTYIPRHGACFACHEERLRKEFPLYDELAAQRMRSPPAATTLGPASALVGAMLATEVLHFLVGDRPPATHDRVLLFDLATLESRWAPVEREARCSRCGG